MEKNIIKFLISIIEASIKNERNDIFTISWETASFLEKNNMLEEAEYIRCILSSNKEVIIQDKKNAINYYELLKRIFVNRKKISSIAPIKIFISGPPGTGKTTLVEKICQENELDLIKINATQIVSSKLGESQKNLEEILLPLLNKKNTVILLDEFDSLIGSRDEKIHNEYHRMVGTFNMILDELSQNTILIAISNKKESIDSSTLRRFNYSISMNKISAGDFIDALNEKSKKLGIKYDSKILKKIVEKNISILNYSMIDDMLFFLMVNNDITPYEFLLNKLGENIDDIKHLNEKYSLTQSEISNITKKSISTIQRKLNENSKL